MHQIITQISCLATFLCRDFKTQYDPDYALASELSFTQEAMLGQIPTTYFSNPRVGKNAVDRLDPRTQKV